MHHSFSHYFWSYSPCHFFPRSCHHHLLFLFYFLGMKLIKTLICCWRSELYRGEQKVPLNFETLYDVLYVICCKNKSEMLCFLMTWLNCTMPYCYLFILWTVHCRKYFIITSLIVFFLAVFSPDETTHYDQHSSQPLQ